MPGPTPILLARTACRSRTGELRVPYLLCRPAVEQSGPVPLVVFLHGAGEKGADVHRLARATLPRIAGQVPAPPFSLLAPQCPDGRAGWRAEEVALAVEEVLRTEHVDDDRVYLTGESMGGRGVWEFAYEHADVLAAAVPVCGFGLPNLAPRLADLPVWAFHGERDEVLPVARTREMADALRAVGAPVRTTYLDAGHEIAEDVYLRPELWEWLLVQRRSARTAQGIFVDTTLPITLSRR